MKAILNLGMSIVLCMLGACGQTEKTSCSADEGNCQAETQVKVRETNEVIETIMSRRSIRKYKSAEIERDKLNKILTCGINAPNGMYKQSWEIRVVNTPEVMNEIEKAYTAYLTQKGKKRISHPSFGAPCLVFIAHDTAYDLSQVDCGLLGENMILAAQSMNLGTCCLGGIVRFMNDPDAAGLLKRLDIPSSYKLLYAIAIGYPDEVPAAKPRNVEKIKFVE